MKDEAWRVREVLRGLYAAATLWPDLEECTDEQLHSLMRQRVDRRSQHRAADPASPSSPESTHLWWRAPSSKWAVCRHCTIKVKHISGKAAARQCKPPKWLTRAEDLGHKIILAGTEVDGSLAVCVRCGGVGWSSAQSLKAPCGTCSKDYARKSCSSLKQGRHPQSGVRFAGTIHGSALAAKRSRALQSSEVMVGI